MNAEIMQRLEDDNIKASKVYLKKQVGYLKSKGITAQAEVAFGDVADRILRTSKIPILMIQPQASGTTA